MQRPTCTAKSTVTNVTEREKQGWERWRGEARLGMNLTQENFTWQDKMETQEFTNKYNCTYLRKIRQTYTHREQNKL